MFTLSMCVSHNFEKFSHLGPQTPIFLFGLRLALFRFSQHRHRFCVPWTVSACLSYFTGSSFDCFRFLLHLQVARWHHATNSPSWQKHNNPDRITIIFFGSNSRSSNFIIRVQKCRWNGVALYFSYWVACLVLLFVSRIERFAKFWCFEPWTPM